MNYFRNNVCSLVERVLGNISIYHFLTSTVYFIFLIRATSDVVPDDIDKACGKTATKPAEEKCVQTFIYKSKFLCLLLLSSS